MGFFGKLFGKEQELPALDAASPASMRIEKFKSELEAFVSKMNDRLEFVPAADAIYVFIGKPPGMFGMAWFHDGKEHNFKTIAKDKGISQKNFRTCHCSSERHTLNAWKNPCSPPRSPGRRSSCIHRKTCSKTLCGSSTFWSSGW